MHGPKIAAWLRAGMAPKCLLAVSSWPPGTSAGDFIIGCGKSHGQMEVYRVERETFLSTYTRWEEPEASCKRVSF